MIQVMHTQPKCTIHTDKRTHTPDILQSVKRELTLMDHTDLSSSGGAECHKSIHK